MDLEPLPRGAPTGWYEDPSGKKRARYWDGVAWTDSVSNDASAKPLPTAESLAAAEAERAAAAREQQRWRSVLLTTSHELPNARIVRHVGETFGITVRTRNAFSNLGAGVRGIVGGEVGGYTKLMVIARNEALERLRQEADKAGANAVISMRLDANQISDLMTEFIAYGAAVVVEALA
jgi:uncharacterized protein YbjQ (UPF0145 family)